MQNKCVNFVDLKSGFFEHFGFSRTPDPSDLSELAIHPWVVYFLIVYVLAIFFNLASRQEFEIAPFTSKFLLSWILYFQD